MESASDDEPIAGPSYTAPRAARKPRSAHPDRPRQPKISRPPKLPAPPAHPSRPGGTTTTHPHLPIKVLQGAGTRRNDSTKQGYGKEVIFVTRKTSLGALMGRCRSLVVDEGYTHLVLHSLGAAIPHALLLLHAVLDTLPYPRGPRGLWYEIHTGTEEYIDHIEAEDPGRPIAKLPKRGKKGQSGPEAGRKAEGEKGEILLETSSVAAGGEREEVGAKGNAATIPSWLAGIGSVEAAAPIRKVRLTSSMKIDIYIGPKPSLEPVADKGHTKQSKAGEGRARPNKKRREALQARQQGAGDVTESKAPEKEAVALDEEDMFNAGASEVEEEVEMR